MGGLAVLVAVVALLVQVWAWRDDTKGAEQRLDQAREALAIQLYTTTNDSAEGAFQRFVADGGVSALLMYNRLSRRRWIALEALMRALDNIAFLFNRNLLDVPGAKERWTPCMKCAWWMSTVQRLRETRATAITPDDRGRVRGVMNAAYPTLRAFTTALADPDACVNFRTVSLFTGGTVANVLGVEPTRIDP